MAMSAPLSVPVELRRETRWFRMATEVSVEELELSSAAPEELTGALEIAFHLPGDVEPIRCHARPHHGTLRFVDLEAGQRGRIEDYIRSERGLTHG